MERVNLVKPGTFSVQVAADNRRAEFDCKNEVIVTNKVPVDFVFIGDSIIQMWELNAYFGKTGQLILNRGINGDKTEYVLKRFEADVLQLKPRYCVMGIGVNDAWTIEPDPWMGYQSESAEAVEEKAFRNFAAIIELSVERQQELIVCSILPTNMTLLNRSKERNTYIKKINSRLMKMCDEKGIIFVDYHSHFVDTDGMTLKSGLTLEGLHPHVFGYNIMADVLRKTLSHHGIII